MRGLQFLTRLIRDQRGISTILFAASSLAMIGATAFATDLGSLYLAKRKLQGLADAAAMSVSESDFQSSSTDAVSELIVKDGSNNVRIVRLQPGIYTPDRSLAAMARFQTSNSASANAMKVTLEQDVPLFFGSLLVGKRTATVHAEALASRADMAAFSIGTKVISTDQGMANMFLSSLAGTPLNLTSADVSLLAGTRLDVLSLADQLAARTGRAGQVYDTILGSSYNLSDVIGALASATTDPGAAAVLSRIQASVGTQQVDLGGLIDLGPLGQSNFHDTRQPVVIDAYTMLRAALQMSQGNTYRIQFNLSVSGLANTSLIIAGANHTEHSPMLTVTAAHDVVIRTASTRVYLDTSVGSSIAGIASLHVPFYAELAPGEARLTGISCSGSDDDGVTLGVKPAIGSAAIGTIDTSQIDNFGAALTVTPARVASTLLATVDVWSNLTLSSNGEQSVLFTIPEVQAHVIKSVSSGDTVASVAQSLVNTSHVSVNALGLGVNAGSITSGVGTALGAAAPAIDATLSSVLRAAGVQLGASQVGIDRLRCGVPMLVA